MTAKVPDPAAVGLEGLAPYWFEMEPQLLVSHAGDVAITVAAAYDLLFTQRLILEPEIELAAAIQEVPEFGVGSGFNDVHLGARLRYEIMREFAPSPAWCGDVRSGGLRIWSGRLAEKRTKWYSSSDSGPGTDPCRRGTARPSGVYDPICDDRP